MSHHSLESAVTIQGFIVQVGAWGPGFPPPRILSFTTRETCTLHQGLPQSREKSSTRNNSCFPNTPTLLASQTHLPLLPNILPPRQFQGFPWLKSQTRHGSSCPGNSHPADSHCQGNLHLQDHTGEETHNIIIAPSTSRLIQVSDDIDTYTINVQ